MLQVRYVCGIYTVAIEWSCYSNVVLRVLNILVFKCWNHVHEQVCTTAVMNKTINGKQLYFTLNKVF